MRFVGKPVDFIAFPGMSAGTINEVLFVSKTGNAVLSNIERSLRDAVERRYTPEYRIPSVAE
nr:Holliday junction resolvase-like protein [Treponema sp. OMZ 803]